MTTAMFSKREIIRMYIPLILELILSYTISLADTLMVAGAGESVLSGVALVGTVNVICVYLFSAMNSGGSVVVSQLIGTGNYPRARHAAKQLLWSSFFVASAMMILAMLFHRPFLSFAFGKVEADVMKNATVYFFIIVMCYPFSAISEACSSILRVTGDTKTSMKISLFANILNVIGNAILIIGFGLGAAGAAISSVFSTIVGTVIRLCIIRRKNDTVYIENILRYKPDWYMFGRIARIGIPNGIENSIFQIGKVLTLSIVSAFGTYQLAANSVANSLTSFQFMAGGAMSTVIVTVVGRCIGAGKKDLAKSYTTKLIGAVYVMNFIVALVTVVFLDPLLAMYNLSPESFAMAKKLVIIHSIGVCTLCPMSVNITSAFRAASDVRYSMVVSVVSMWACRVGLSYVLGQYMGLGVLGVWYAMLIDWVVRAVFYTTRYLRGTWLKKYQGFENAS